MRRLTITGVADGATSGGSTVPVMPDRFRTWSMTWSFYAFIAVTFGLWGVSKLTRGSGGSDTFFGIVFLVIAVGHTARAVSVARSARP